jgi:hypothetical protein
MTQPDGSRTQRLVERLGSGDDLDRLRPVGFSDCLAGAGCGNALSRFACDRRVGRSVHGVGSRRMDDDWGGRPRLVTPYVVAGADALVERVPDSITSGLGDERRLDGSAVPEQPNRRVRWRHAPG